MTTSHIVQFKRMASRRRALTALLTALLTASVAWLLVAAPAPAGGTDAEPDVARAKAMLQKRTAELGPDHPDTLAAMADLAKAYCDDGDANKAVPLYEKVQRTRRDKLGADHPDTLRAMVNLGRAYIFAGNAAKGSALLEQGVKRCEAVLGPNCPTTRDAVSFLAHARVATGETKTFQVGMPLPQWIMKPVLKLVGPQWMAKLIAGQTDAAIAELTDAIRANPKDAQAYFARGCVWNMQHQYDRAIADLDAAIRLDPWRADAYAQRGNCWADKGNQDRAITDFTTAIRLDPQGRAWRYRNRAGLDMQRAIRQSDRRL